FAAEAEFTLDIIANRKSPVQSVPLPGWVRFKICIEAISVFEGFTRFPGPVLVHKFDPFAQGRVAGAKSSVENSRAWIGKVLVHQLHEPCRRRVVILRQLQAK